MKSITITAAMNRLVTCLTWGMPFEIKPNSQITETLRDSDIIPNPPPSNLNQGMYVRPDFNPETETRDLKLGVLMVGRGGHAYQTDINGEIDPTTYPHKATHTGMFAPLPLIARRLVNDLTGAEKDLYRLRVTGAINNELWVFYFGRRFDATQNEIIEVLETVENGVVQNPPIVYEPTVNDLRPQREDLSGNSDGIFMRTYASTDVSFTAEQIDEIKYACEQLYGNENKAVISEIAFCFGKDKTVERQYAANGTTLQNAPPNSKEFVACHMGIVESTFKPVIYTGGISDIKNIGISEPLYGGR